MKAWLRDLRIGLRMLRKSPETTLVAIVAMAASAASVSSPCGAPSGRARVT